MATVPLERPRAHRRDELTTNRGLALRDSYKPLRRRLVQWLGRALAGYGLTAVSAAAGGCWKPSCAGEPPVVEVLDASGDDELDAIPLVDDVDARDEPTLEATTRLAPSRLVIATASQLDAFDDFSRVRSVELGPGPLAARVSTPAADDPRCGLPEPTELAARLPGVERVRLAGCTSLLASVLSAFADRVAELELVDMTLDRESAESLAAMPNLKSLVLVRMVAPELNTTALARRLPIKHLALRELARDTPLLELVSDCPQLTELELEGRWVRYSAMQSVTKASRLESLTLLDTTVGNYGLNLVKPLSKLRRLHWESTAFNDHSPLYLRDLPIEEVVCACPRLGDAGLRHFRLLSQLRALDLRQPNVSPAGWQHLARLEQLETLRVTHAEIGQPMFTALAELDKLHTVRLEQVELTTPDLADLGRLGALEVLELRVPEFGDKHARHLAGLTRLRELDLGSTSISDAGLGAVAELSALTTLRLHHTRVTNEGLAHVGKLANLRVLELDHTDVVDEGVQHLKALVQLRELRLDRTLITDAGIAHLAKMHELERLNLADTVVTDDALPTLARLPNLRALNLAGTRTQGAPPSPDEDSP